MARASVFWLYKTKLFGLENRQAGEPRLGGSNPPPSVLSCLGRVSRGVVGRLGLCEGLVVAGGVACEFANQLAFQSDHMDALVGD